jgi:hypothetical protein
VRTLHALFLSCSSCQNVSKFPQMVPCKRCRIKASPLPNYVREWGMTQTSVPQRHEQRKVEGLLLKLSKVKPISAKAAPVVPGKSAIRAAGTASPQVFFST